MSTTSCMLYIYILFIKGRDEHCPICLRVYIYILIFTHTHMTGPVAMGTHNFDYPSSCRGHFIGTVELEGSNIQRVVGFRV